MLEVINGFLLSYFVILCTISALVPYLVKPIAATLNKRSSEEKAIWAEIGSLKEEQKQYSMKDEFAAFSKIQRKISKLETHLKENSQSRISRSIAVKGSVHVILQAFISLMIVGSVIWYRNEPLVVLKGNLFPLSSVLQYPCDMPNAISTHVWVLISNVSIRSIVKPLLP